MVGPLWALNTKKFVLPEKVAKVHQNFYWMLPPKTSHHAKFHRDRLNQLGVMGGVNWASNKKNLSRTNRSVTTWVAPCSVREARLKIRTFSGLFRTWYTKQSAPTFTLFRASTYEFDIKARHRETTLWMLTKANVTLLLNVLHRGLTAAPQLTN